MPRKKQSRGVCVYCGAAYALGGMLKHLTACPQRQLAITVASETAGAKKETLYLMRVRDVYASDFWLFLEVRGSSALQDLDKYLRAIWLECCGHMSQFSFGGWSGEEISMRRRISGVFELGDELTHIYDFGTSSETLIKAVGLRTGAPTTRHPIALLARNQLPEVVCQACDQPGAYFCQECQIEEDKPGVLCNEHAKGHPHKNYGRLTLRVNSPRLGMCGYLGPANPPY